MSFISAEMEKILEEDQMMEAFSQNAERELGKMFDMVQEEEGHEKAVHNKLVGALCTLYSVQCTVYSCQGVVL